ncbi:MAG: hypothetical protein HF975_04520 [ANME-2 cluster archaeon]|nr:hypothetical protein [ANME-2 cluster archaeon]
MPESTDISKEDIELASLNIIIDSHCKQSLAIPALLLRTMKLGQDPEAMKKQEAAQELFRNILDKTFNGVELSTCKLAIAFLEAEIASQMFNAQQDMFIRQISDIRETDNQVMFG